MKTAKDLRKEFSDLTGKGTEVPGFIGEPIVFTQSYVRWLEKKLINASEQTVILKELVKAYEELDKLNNSKPGSEEEWGRFAKVETKLRKRIEELSNNLK